jgi:hypothetical protein
MREALITGAVLLIVALVLARGLTEETQALILGAAALIGAVYYTALPVAEQSTSRRVAAGLYVFAAVWLVGAGFPFWKLLRPGDPVTSVSLSGEGVERSLGTLGAGRYLLLAEVPGSAVASEAAYVLSVSSGKEAAQLRGRFSRSSAPRRGVGGTRAVGESVHAAEYHEIVLGAGESKVRLESIDGSLGGAMGVRVFADAAPRTLWLGIQVLLLLCAAVLDALFAERKRRSTLAVGASFTFLFNLAAIHSIRPGYLVRPLIGAGIVALLAALALGFLLTWVARGAAHAVRHRRAAA